MTKEPITKVERYFEEDSTLRGCMNDFDRSGFFHNVRTETYGPYKKLIGVSSLDLYTMRTKFSDAVLFVPVEKTVSKKKVEEKELVSV